jgi:hypothetical protein
MIAGLKVRILLIGALIVGVAGVIFAVLRSAKNAGRVEEQVKALERTLENVIKKEEVMREINSLSDGAAADRLRQHWSRD